MRGSIARRVIAWGAIVRETIVLGGNCPWGGTVRGAIVLDGNCPGGNCPGGIVLFPIVIIIKYYYCCNVGKTLKELKLL